MAYGEYITTVKDYEKKLSDAQSLPPALQGQMPTSLCKEKIKIKTLKKNMPKNPLEEIIFWNLSR